MAGAKRISRRTLELMSFEKRLFLEEVLIPEGKYELVEDDEKQGRKA